MNRIIYILILVISANLFCQAQNEKTYSLINELIRDNYSNKVVQLDSIPCNDKLIVDGSYLQQNIGLINDNLTKNEILFLLNFCDSSRCFLQFEKLDLRIKLCDSTTINITELNNRLKVPKSTLNQSFKWQSNKIETKAKGKIFNYLAFSYPIVNDNETIMIIHIIRDIGKYGMRGETILFKKLNNKWTSICDLFAWVT